VDVHLAVSTHATHATFRPIQSGEGVPLKGFEMLRFTLCKKYEKIAREFLPNRLKSKNALIKNFGRLFLANPNTFSEAIKR